MASRRRWQVAVVGLAALLAGLWWANRPAQTACRNFTVALADAQLDAHGHLQFLTEAGSTQRVALSPEQAETYRNRKRLQAYRSGSAHVEITACENVQGAWVAQSLNWRAARRSPSPPAGE